MAKLPAGCREFYNFCNALVKVARTLPLAAKSCELFPSSAAKDFFAVTLRQPYNKLAAGFSFSKGTSGQPLPPKKKKKKTKKKTKTKSNTKKKLGIGSPVFLHF